MDIATANRKCKKLFPEDQKICDNCGVNIVMKRKIWEIWVIDERGQPATRFLQENDNNEIEAFNSFEQLVASLDQQHTAVLSQLKEAQSEYELKKIKLQEELQQKASQQSAERSFKKITQLTAAIGLVLTLPAFIYIFYQGGTPMFPALVILATVVATTSTALWGKFDLNP